MKSDSELKRDVENELRWERSVDEAHIGVTARDGVVTLTGNVPSYAEKAAAERAAKRVYGVKGVADELEVKLPSRAKRTDEDIATACVDALAANYSVPDSRIKTLVRDGWVTLEGEVDWQYQRQSAFNSVRQLTGVRGVTNDITIKVRVSPRNVREQIEAAFKRNAEIDARRVSVEARDGKVILSGAVRSWTERDQAQRAAWGAPGVADVENRILVTP
jgi:osmotically-inducible protein OsmY